MGFKRRTYRLTFDDPTLEGLEVRMRAATIDQIIQLNQVFRPSIFASTDPEDEGRRDQLFDLLAAGIVSWNREEDDGTPIEPDAKGLRGEDVDIVGAIVKGWSKASSGVPSPLAPASSAGALSVEASIPTETLPESPQSLSEPS